MRLAAKRILLAAITIPITGRGGLGGDLPVASPARCWDLRSWQNVAQLELARGRTDAAVAALEIVARMRPDLPEVHGQLGSVLAQLMRYSEAAREFRHVLSLVPGDARAHRELALALSNLSELDAAARELETCVSLAPHDVDAHYLLAMTLAQMATDPVRSARIARELAAVLQRDPRHVGALYLSGNVHLRDGDCGGAIAPLRSLVAIAPDLAPAHYALGTALVRSGQQREGRQSLATFARLQAFERDLEQAARAIQREPLQPEHRYRAAQLLLAHGNREPAWRLLTEVVALDPARMQAWRDLGALLVDAAQPARAAAWLAPVVRADPGDWQARLQLARAHAALGYLTDAECELRLCAGNDPAWPLPHQYLAEILERAGRHQEALAARSTYQQLMQREPCAAIAE